MEKTVKASSKKKLSRKARIGLLCWLFILPTFISYLAFTAWPIISSAYFSMLDWSGLSLGSKFVGLDNYKELLTDKLYWNAFFNSFKYTIYVLPLMMLVSLMFAYILNDGALKFRTGFRTVLFIPVITTTSIVGIIMVFIWGNAGFINAAIKALNIWGGPVNWLGHPKISMTTVVIISVWKTMGIYMVYWLAALQSVPKDLYDAAVVDGAGKVRTLKSVVLPMIASSAGTIAILCTIDSLKVFDIIKTLTNGGPFYATDVIGTYVYSTAFSGDIAMPRLGYASAAALFFGVIVIASTLVLRGMRKSIT